MARIKALIGLVTMMGLLAVAAAPASAWFESNPAGSTHGKGNLKTGTTAEFRVSSSAPALKCTSVPSEWKIRKEEAKQEETTAGGHLNVTSKWEGCTVEVLFIKVPVKVEGCELQVEQAKNALTGTGSVITTCVITIETKPTCTIEVQPTGNQKLGKVALTNSGSNLEAKNEITGITSVYPAKTATNEKNAETCKADLGEPGKEGSFKATTIGEGLKAI